MENKELNRLEKELGIKRKENTREQIQVAYALNLCAVSVSQIIDYNDINILDQEYDAILNNLNLENIPKDEALLDILEHVLETIVFFKIQDEEKKIAEKEYQNKIKNAVWQAMPNPGALVYAGLQRGVVGAITSLAATVGTAYMSYRKSKSNAAQEHEKREWELRRTALEQFQMLQQQLFETSWRLADKYNFSDELRLNVKQIKQFNSILVDPDEVRKYERLRSIQHKFGAYPPFWYYLGNTANSIALNNMYGLDDEDREHYRTHARNCFEYFTIINEYHLLREDTITAGCYLEYAGLLDPEKDKEKIYELIGKAANMAGNSLDILQLCATAYMGNGNIQDAERLLRQLVNEQYNEVANAQLLSMIYVNNYIKTGDGKAEYKLLGSRVRSEYLFPLPDQSMASDTDALQEKFVKSQRNILLQKYGIALDSVVRKYEAEINRIILLPESEGQGVSDDIYAETGEARKERVQRIKMLDDAALKLYQRKCEEIPYTKELFALLNQMFGAFCLLECMQTEDVRENMRRLMEKDIKAHKEQIKNARDDLRSEELFTTDKYERIQKEMTLKKLAGSFLKELKEAVTRSVNAKTELQDFAIAEVRLAEFCKKEGLAEPEILYKNRGDIPSEIDAETFFTPELLGDTDENKERNLRYEIHAGMRETIRNYMTEITRGCEYIEFFTADDPRMERYFSTKLMTKNHRLKKKVLAVMDDRSRADKDLVFTYEGILLSVKGKWTSRAHYSKIEWSGGDGLLIWDTKYSNGNIDMDKLYELIQKLEKSEEKFDWEK